MDKMTQGIGLLIAGHIQALALIFAAWWIGNWADQHYPKSFSWYVVTFPVAVVAIGQTLYTIIRHVMRMGNQKNESTRENLTDSQGDR